MYVPTKHYENISHGVHKDIPREVVQTRSNKGYLTILAKYYQNISKGMKVMEGTSFCLWMEIRKDELMETS